MTTSGLPDAYIAMAWSSCSADHAFLAAMPFERRCAITVVR